MGARGYPLQGTWRGASPTHISRLHQQQHHHTHTYSAVQVMSCGHHHEYHFARRLGQCPSSMPAEQQMVGPAAAVRAWNCPNPSGSDDGLCWGEPATAQPREGRAGRYQITTWERQPHAGLVQSRHQGTMMGSPTQMSRVMLSPSLQPVPGTHASGNHHQNTVKGSSRDPAWLPQQMGYPARR